MLALGERALQGSSLDPLALAGLGGSTLRASATDESMSSHSGVAIREVKPTMTEAALPKPDASLSATEAAVAALWHEVLQTSEPLSATDDFFAMGGSSMHMVMLEYRLQEEFSIELPAGVLLGAPTLREISALVDAECHAAHQGSESNSGVE
jgi:acyl carrier protein